MNGVSIELLRENVENGETVMAGEYFAGRNASAVSEKLKFVMLDERFGYMTAYFDNRSNTVVVIGKSYFLVDNFTAKIFLTKPVICDFRSQNGALLDSVAMHYFSKYLFYCNLTRKAVPNDTNKVSGPAEISVPAMISLRFNGAHSFNKPIPVRIPPRQRQPIGKTSF